MCIDGDVLELDMEMDLEEVKSLKDFVQERLNYIEEIVVLRSQNGLPSTSALFTFLFWVKRQKPSLKIDILDAMTLDLEAFGRMYWIADE